VAKYTLTIETEDSDEFAAIANRLAGADAQRADPPAPWPPRPTNEAAPAKQTRAAKPKAEEPVREQVGQPEPPVQPTNVDPAVLAAQNSGQGAKETAVADAAAAQGASFSGEAVTLDDLKALMTKALNANSAKTCQDAVRAAANGAPGLSAVAVEHYAAVRDALLPLAG
jgi:outer membrane biosynthesis protein TonB